jgi:hypothetical protein
VLKAADIWSMSKRELASVVAAGHAIDDAALEGDFFGVSLGLPPLVERLTWKVFRKTFRRRGDAVVGENVRMEQVGPTGPGEPKTKNGEPVTFGPFRVVDLPGDGTPFGCKSGVVLDYGREHPIWHPMAPVRDVLVAVNRGSSDLLVGALYLEVAGMRTKTSSFFTLEREATRGI